MKKHIITIAGDHASGQGTLSNLLKEKYGYEIYRNGQYVSKLAKENNISITQFQDYLKIHPELDRKIEQSAKEYADSRDNLIIDAKLGWYSVPESFKIYLKVDIKEAVKRAFMDENRKDTENYKSIEEAEEKIIYRHEEENKRWYDEYKVNRDDMSNYDLVIDTTSKTPKEVFEIVVEEYEKWLNK